jgi:flagellar hook assembly protein FlgD
VGVRVTDKSGNLATAAWSFSVESSGGTAMVNLRNFPNPFASSTTIAFTLSRRSKVSIQIFDVTLRPVRVLRDEVMSAGPASVAWDGTSADGEDLARGVYFGQVIIHDDLKPEHAVLKMALTRAAAQ